MLNRDRGLGLLYNRGFDEVELMDSLKFFRDAIICGVVTEQELHLLFQLRIFDTPIEELAKQFDVPNPEWLKHCSVSV